MPNRQDFILCYCYCKKSCYGKLTEYVMILRLTAAEAESTKDEIICLEKEVRSREKKFQEKAALPTNFVEPIRHEVELDSVSAS